MRAKKRRVARSTGWLVGGRGVERAHKSCRIGSRLHPARTARPSPTAQYGARAELGPCTLNDDCMLDLGVKQYDEFATWNMFVAIRDLRPARATGPAGRGSTVTRISPRGCAVVPRTRPAIAMAIARPTLSCRIAFEYSFDEFSGYAVSRYRGTMIPRSYSAPGASTSPHTRPRIMRDQESPQNSST
jgi:hypothetical protein